MTAVLIAQNMMLLSEKDRYYHLLFLMICQMMLTIIRLI